MNYQKTFYETVDTGVKHLNLAGLLRIGKNSGMDCLSHSCPVLPTGGGYCPDKAGYNRQSQASSLVRYVPVSVNGQFIW